MTEIPEHLLKRSRERRDALGDGDAGSDAASPTAATPAVAGTAAPAASPAASGPVQRASAPAPVGPPPRKPDSAVVAAYKARKKIPFWAMLALSALPIWAILYARSVTTQAKEVAGPLGVGAEVYSGCASCHGTDGGGVAGLGYQFSNGEVLKTFPNIEDQLRYVYFGTDNYNLAGVEIYGDPNRDGGAHITGVRGLMPGQGGGLLDDEILSVVCHERYTLGGADPAAEYLEEFEKWCSEESPMFAALVAGGTLATLHELDDTIIPIGDAPVAGSPAKGE